MAVPNVAGPAPVAKREYTFGEKVSAVGTWVAFGGICVLALGYCTIPIWAPLAGFYGFSRLGKGK